MKFKLITALLISLVPVNSVRIALFRGLLGYKFGKNCRVAPLTLLLVDSFEAGDNLTIGPLNYFKGPMTVSLGNNVWIGRQNQINSSWSIAQTRFTERSYKREFILGDGALIQHEHYFDVYGRFQVGAGSWIVGRGSQFWTHGLSVEDRDIIIGDNNVISTRATFAPGSGIGNGNIVSLASVLLKRLAVDDHIIGGYPAVPLKDIKAAKEQGKYHFSRDDW